jgi:hypothetical protein
MRTGTMQLAVGCRPRVMLPSPADANRVEIVAQLNEKGQR